MYWSNVIVSKIENGLIMLNGKDSSKVSFIESSNLTITGDNKGSQSIIISEIDKCSTNVVVVKLELFNKKNQYGSRFGFILKIDNFFSEKLGDFKLYITEWQPTLKDRLGVVDKDGFIEMRIGDKLFSTDPSRKGVYFIGEKNICANYLAGRIGAYEVLASAKETQQKISLQEEYDNLLGDNKGLLNEIVRLRKDLQCLKDNEVRTLAGVSKLMDDLKKAKENYDILNIVNNKLLSQNSRLKESSLQNLFGVISGEGSNSMTDLKKIKEENEFLKEEIKRVKGGLEYWKEIAAALIRAVESSWISFPSVFNWETRSKRIKTALSLLPQEDAE